MSEPSGSSGSDPFDDLLRQELARQLAAAWEAYQALAQTAWDGPDNVVVAAAVVAVAPAAAVVTGNAVTGSTERRPVARRLAAGTHPEAPIELSD
jgi:hypothetical protein